MGLAWSRRPPRTLAWGESDPRISPATGNTTRHLEEGHRERPWGIYPSTEDEPGEMFFHAIIRTAQRGRQSYFHFGALPGLYPARH
eukprot:14482490-Heterocapsa_arctica.AAC.1